MKQHKFFVVALSLASILSFFAAADSPKKASPAAAKGAKPTKAAAAGAAVEAPKTSKIVFNADGNGSVEFLAVGKPAMIKILGKGPGAKGDLEVTESALGGKLTFDLTTLDTGMKLRNEHTKDKYLEVGKFPEAQLTLDPITIAEVSGSGDFTKEKVPFSGKLKLHGEEKPVSGTATIARKAKELSVKAEFGLKTGDFKIDTPKYMGITVADDVKVNTDFTAKTK